MNNQIIDRVSSCQDCDYCPLFYNKPVREIPIEFISCLNRLKKTKKVESHTDLSEYINSSNNVTFIKSGLVKILFKTGRKSRVRFVYPGEILCGPEIFELLPANTKVKAAEETMLCSLPVESFWELVGSTKELLQSYLMQLSNSRERLTNEYLVGSCLSVKARLARFLMNDFTRRGKRSGGILRVSDCLSQDEIGQSIGVTRETVSRELAKLKRQGIIGAASRELKLLEEAELHKVCEFN